MMAPGPSATWTWEGVCIHPTQRHWDTPLWDTDLYTRSPEAPWHWWNLTFALGETVFCYYSFAWNKKSKVSATNVECHYLGHDRKPWRQLSTLSLSLSQFQGRCVWAEEKEAGIEPVGSVEFPEQHPAVTDATQTNSAQFAVSGKAQHHWVLVSLLKKKILWKYCITSVLVNIAGTRGKC